MTSNEFDRFSSCITAKEIWDGLELAHEGTSAVRKYRIDLLIQKYELFTMEKNESLDIMSAPFSSIINELNNLGRKFESEDIARKVFRSLSKRWRPKVTTMEEYRDLTALPYAELIGALMANELVLEDDEAESKDDEGSKDEEVANLCLSNVSLDLISDSDEDNLDSNYCFLGESDSNEEGEVTYLELKKRFKKLSKSALSEFFEQSLDKCHEQVLKSKDLKEQILDIAEENQLLKAKVMVKESNQWYLDSGCSRYMTGNVNLFLSLEPFDGGKVTFSDNKKGGTMLGPQSFEEDELSSDDNMPPVSKKW
ncbi:uncharacterized protein LOC141631049 [Silene latifolia]|uniref:uncharacterized protein LOC141631049 n=1 Tax=Silene latifolia TaxID=37657 RepID=UPI003D76D8F6